MDNTPRAARPWLGITIAAVAVFGTCWSASIAYWRAAGSTPSGMAIGSLLLGLPAALVLALWLGSKALPARSGAKPAAPPATAGNAEPARQRGPLPHIVAGAAIALPVLRLHPVLPSGWQAGLRQATADWLLHLVEQQGWPAQRLMLSPASADDAVAQQQTLALVVACASHIGEDSVRDWGERGILFSGRTPRGQVPGEGAAGLLLADAAQAALLAQESLVTLHGACDGRRGVCADARGNISSELLAGLGQRALHESKVEPADVTTLCADADLRPSRMGELMGMASTLLPQLDQSAQMMSVGACCGTAGAVGPLAALALAAHDALANGGQVLCVSNSDSRYRCALVLRPA